MQAGKRGSSVLIAVAAFVAGMAAIAPAASALTWSQAIPVARSAPFSDYGVPVAVSCPSTRLCVGVDTFGNVFSTTNPRSGPWSGTTVLHGRLTVVATETSTQAFTGIACPSAAACLATDNHGDLITSRDPTGGAAAWRVLRPPALRRTHADAIACPNAGLCLLGLDNGRIAVSTRPLGGTAGWARSQPLHRGFKPSAISCPTRRLCVVGGYHGINGSYAVALSARGRVLSVRRQRGSGGGFEALSCPTARLCFGNTWGSHIAFIRRPGDARSRWTVTAAHYADYDPTGSLSCPTSHLCAAGIFTSRDQAEVLVSTRPTDGRSWHVAKTTQPLAEVVSSVSAVSCPSVRLCVALDDEGEALASTAPARRTQPWIVSGADGGNQLPGIACASASNCLALVAGRYLAAPSGYTGVTPSGRSPVTRLTSGDAVACAAATLCVWSDNQGVMYTGDPASGGATAPSGAVLPSTHDPCPAGPRDCDGSFLTTNWLACASAALCVGFGLDSAGTPYSSSSIDPANGYTTWTTDAHPSFVGGPTSCPSPTLCVTVSMQSIAATSTPTDGGSWRPAVVEPAGASLTGIACPTVSLCVASDSQGGVLISTNPASATSWTRSTIDPTHALNGVACGSATSCVAFDDRGTALQSSSPTNGSSWSSTSLVSGTDVYGKPIALLAGACTGPGACVLTDSVGNLYYGSATGIVVDPLRRAAGS